MGSYEDAMHEERYDWIKKQRDSESDSEYLDRKVEGMLSTDREIQRKANEEGREEMKSRKYWRR